MWKWLLPESSPCQGFLARQEQTKGPGCGLWLGTGAPRPWGSFSRVTPSRLRDLFCGAAWIVFGVGPSG